MSTGPEPVRTRFAAPSAIAIRVLLFALGSLPFLVPVHLRPITSFYGEWLAGVLGLALFAAVLVARRGRTLPLPWMLWLPATLLAVIGLQLAVGRVYFAQQALIHASYLLLAGIAMSSGRAAVEELGATAASAALAAGIAVGALLQAAVGALQFQQMVLPGWTTPLEGSHSVYGNLGQPNLLGDYLWLGIASLALLFVRRTIGGASMLAGSVALMVVAPLTGSRSALLYPVALGAIGMLMLRRARADSSALGTSRIYMVLVPVALALAFAVGALSALMLADGGNAIGRVVAAAATPGSEGIRIALLATGITASLATPWLGGGVGAVPLQSLEFAPRGGELVAFGIAEHYHNLPLNWMAEFGIPATSVSIALCAALVLTLVRRRPSAEVLWSLAVFAIVGIHSMLEYPLWHAFFVVPIALLAGAASPSRAGLRLGGTMLVALGGALLLGANLLHQMRIDHGALARVSHLVPAGPGAEEIWRRHVDDLLLVHRASLFSPYVSGMLVVAFDIGRQRIDDKSALCESAIRFSPAPEVLFKCAMNDALAGAVERARHRLRLAVAAFPAEAKLWRPRLEGMAVEHVELRQLADLLPAPQPLAAD